MFNKKERLIKKRDLLVNEINELSGRLNEMVKKDRPFSEIKPILDEEIKLANELGKITKKIININNVKLNKYIKTINKKIREVL